MQAFCTTCYIMNSITLENQHDNISVPIHLKEIEWEIVEMGLEWKKLEYAFWVFWK